MGEEKWNKAPFKMEGREWSELTAARVEELLTAGIEMQLAEVEACHSSGGGPHLESWRRKGDPHLVCSPRWSEEARFPIPEKVPGNSLKLEIGRAHV